MQCEILCSGTSMPGTGIRNQMVAWTDLVRSPQSASHEPQSPQNVIARSGPPPGWREPATRTGSNAARRHSTPLSDPDAGPCGGCTWRGGTGSVCNVSGGDLDCRMGHSTIGRQMGA